MGYVVTGVLAALVAAVVSVLGTNAYHKRVEEQKIGTADEKARRILDDAIARFREENPEICPGM